MEVSETNELEVPEINNRNPTRILISTVLKCLTMYIFIPLLIFHYLLSFLSPVSDAPQFEGKLFAYFLIFMLYFFYKKGLDSVFYANGTSIKKEWINYLTFKKLKIGYYKKAMHYLEIWDFISNNTFLFVDGVAVMIRRGRPVFLVASFILVWYLLCARIWLPFQEQISGLSVGNALSSLISFPNFSSDLINVLVFFFFSAIITALTLFVVIIILVFSITIPYQCIFPTIDGIIDATDVPISFIEDAIEKLESFNFSCNFEEKLNKKKQIIERISYASENFIDVDNSSQTIACTNICFIFIFDQFNNKVVEDIIFRTNGLYKKIEELCVKINYMKSQEEQEQIVHDLKMYLKMIKDRDLSEIPPVEFEIKKPGFSSLIIKSLGILNKIFF